MATHSGSDLSHFTGSGRVATGIYCLLTQDDECLLNESLTKHGCVSASLGCGLGSWSKEGFVAGYELMLAPSLGCLECFLGPKVLTLGDMVRAGGLARDPLARQVLSLSGVCYVFEKFSTYLPQGRNQNFV